MREGYCQRRAIGCDAGPRERVEHLAFEHGLLLLTCGASTVRMAPPLLITRPEVEEGLAIFEHVVGLAAGELG